MKGVFREIKRVQINCWFFSEKVAKLTFILDCLGAIWGLDTMLLVYIGKKSVLILFLFTN